MNFTLIYRGDLKASTKSNNRIDDKHKIRLAIHHQLKELWNHYPFNDYQVYHFENRKKILSIVKGINFAPLISEKKYLTAELKIQILSSDSLDSVIIKSGDIDNRLKTLFDALRLPQNESELPDNLEPFGEKYFYTLLADDSLITKCDIETGRLLDLNRDGRTLIIINVTIVPINFPIGGLRVESPLVKRRNK